MTAQSRVKPANYGHWWNTNQLDEKWYRSIFEVRPRAHSYFLDWVGSLHRHGESIQTVLEVGCGRGEPYAGIFKEYDYYGTDISEKEIRFCQENHSERADKFFVSDFIEVDLGQTYDMVFAHAVIDHVYDINAFLAKMAVTSGRWLYVSCYRGWHPRLMEHRYEWLDGYDCYNNHVSPTEAARALNKAGCSEVQVFPNFVGNTQDQFPLETVIIAKAPGAG